MHVRGTSVCCLCPRSAAKTLGHFNNGASLAQRFIATRPMFMSVESLHEIEALREAAPRYYGTGGSAAAAAAAGRSGQMATEADAAAAAEYALEAGFSGVHLARLLVRLCVRIPRVRRTAEAQLAEP